MSIIISFEKNDFVIRIAQQLNVEIVIPNVVRFADGELDISFSNQEKIKNQRVFLLHTLRKNNNESIMKLLLLIYKIKYAQAKEIIGVIPYFPYSRQAQEGTISNAHTIIDVLEHAGINQFVCVELHDQSIRSLFKVPLQQIFMDQFIAHHIQLHVPENDYCIVAPDAGAQERVKKIAMQLKKNTVFYRKKREGQLVALVSSQGRCQNSTAIIIDDIIDTGSTAHQVAKDLRAHGVTKLYGYFIHPVFAVPPVEIIQNLKFERMFVSNSISQVYEQDLNIEQFDCSGELIPILKSLNL